MDETVYKRSSKGKKMSKPDGTTRKLLFNNQTVTMTRTVRIGRDKSNDIVLPDSLVSRQHAVIELRKGQYTITDLDSKNCTYVNSNPLRENEKRKLCRGDKIKIGNTVLDIL
jgi:pSer/pThr/pTyr-binding forkhead associated (FHA) protein